MWLVDILDDEVAEAKAFYEKARPYLPDDSLAWEDLGTVDKLYAWWHMRKSRRK